MKKFLSTVLASAMLFSLVACNNEGATQTASEPVYTSEEKFEIGMWVGVGDKIVTYDDWGGVQSSTPLTDEQFLEKYQEIADAGFTVAYPGYSYMLSHTEAYNKRCLEAASKVGIKQIISLSTLREYFATAKTLYDAGALTKEEAVEKVRSLLKPYTEYEYADALYGVMIQDEPDASKFDQLGFAQEIFAEAAPDLMFYTNLFPVIAQGSQLGGTSPINYDTYIAQYLEKIKTPYISYDHYPLFKSGKNYSLESSFLQNMEIIRNAIDEEGEGREMWTFLQSISYGAKNRALESVGDASFQMYSFLAYGGDAVQWFCYACPPPNDGATVFGNNALLDRNYEKTDTYTYVQTANQYVQALMPWYKNFEWQGVMTTSEDGGEGNFERIEKMSGTDTLSKVEGTADGLVGVFKDKDGRDGYMVVNFTDPARKISNTMSLSVTGVHNAIVVKNGVKTTVPVKDGKIIVALEAGEGCFVIPY